MTTIQVVRHSLSPWTRAPSPVYVANFCSDSFFPMATQPRYKAEIQIPADVFREAKEAGPNDRGLYTITASFWNNDRRQNDRQPNFTGQVQVKGRRDGAKGYCSMWDNTGGSSAPAAAASASSDDDLF